MKLLSKMSSLSVLGVLVAGCSSGYERFDHFYKSALPDQRQAQANNPYPGVDPTTTASTGRLQPLKDVKPASVPQAVYHHQPEPTLAAPQAVYTPQPYKPYASAQAAPVSSAPAWKGTSGVSASALPPATRSTARKPVPEVEKVAAPAPVYTPPKPDTTSETVYIAPKKPDPITTAAVKPEVVAPVSPQPVSAGRNEQGWTNTGGTTIQARSGETLYNLSKRYGVPVSAIRAANGMSEAESLKAGQKVLIPNYVFSPTAPVSAPDHDSGTRAARASTGLVGEANPLSVPVPTHRPYSVAAVSPSGETQDGGGNRYTPKTHVEPPVSTPDHGITTSSLGGYTVQPGDSLGKIAATHGVSVAALQSANNLSGSAIGVGQNLVIPGASTAQDAISAAKSNAQNEIKTAVPANVDPVTTASVQAAAKTEAPAPARTGISNFRWPVNGRVVEPFGAQTADGKNEGIDISVPEGTAVKAAENGVVIYAGNGISSYGNLILIRHSDDWVSAYAHNKSFDVKKGDKVNRGQTIARSGRTGETDRPKLHFELRKNSVPVNPTSHLTSS